MLTEKKGDRYVVNPDGNWDLEEIVQLAGKYEHERKPSIVGVVFTVLLLTTVGLGFAVLIKLLLGVLL